MALVEYIVNCKTGEHSVVPISDPIAFQKSREVEVKDTSAKDAAIATVKTAASTGIPGGIGGAVVVEAIARLLGIL